MNEDIQIYENANVIQIDKNYNSQVDIAKRYPRDIKRAVNNCIAIATMDRETAETCGYTIPRSGKKISGASINLAKIIVLNYGNIRVEIGDIEVFQDYVTASAIAFDLETNIASRRKESKSIISSKGIRYSNDMIIMTGKAASAIALRNAIFDIIPKSIVDKIYKESMNFITGDLSDETKLIKRRKSAIDKFKEEYGVEEFEILNALGLKTINQIRQEEIIVLINMYNSLKSQEFTVDEMFDRLPEPDENDLKINTPESFKNE